MLLYNEDIINCLAQAYVIKIEREAELIGQVLDCVANKPELYSSAIEILSMVIEPFKKSG